MTRSIRNILTVGAALPALASCGGGAPADLHGLPEDDAQRATLCSQAAVAFTSSAEMQGLDAAEKERRQALMQQVVDATDFFGATGTTEEEGREMLGDLEAMLTGGNWLTVLNQCKAAYELGAAEEVPALPAEPAQKAAACGAASLLANLDGRSIDDIKNMIEDPQAAYFLTVMVSEAGGNFSGAEKAMVEQIEKVVAGGAVGTLHDACLADYPKAKMGSEVALPEADDEAVVLCSFANEMTASMPGADEKRIAAMTAKLEAQPGNLVSNARFDQLETKMFKIAAEAGTAPDVVKACEARYK